MNDNERRKTQTFEHSLIKEWMEAKADLGTHITSFKLKMSF